MIPIFTGKQATYNIQILETLLLKGEMTAWQLAKYIAPNIKTLKRTKHSTTTQKVYSVLLRKGGRLNDLKMKEYITFNNASRKWRLAVKGALAVWIKNPELKTKLSNKYYNTSMFNNLNFPEKMKLPFLGFTMNGKKFERGMSQLVKHLEVNKTKIISSLAEEAEKCIEEGINLDKIKTKSLMILLVQRAKFNFITEDLLQTFQEVL